MFCPLDLYEFSMDDHQCEETRLSSSDTLLCIHRAVNLGLIQMVGMMFGVRATCDSHKFESDMGRFSRDQIPFACAKALTKTAQESQRAVKANLSKKFTIRTPWVAKGIQIEPAIKKDWPNQKAVIGSRDAFMALQEEGKDKQPGKKSFSIPKGIRDNTRQLVPRSKWPGKLLAQSKKATGKRRKSAKPKPFVVTINGNTGVYVRTGDKRRLKLLYALTRKPIHLKRREFLVKTVTAIAPKKFPIHFEKALMDAISTRR